MLTPDAFWPQTWSGWIIIFGGIGTLWLIFGPFMKERLRRFLCDAETLLLLAKLVIEILKKDDVGLVIKEIVEHRFAYRFAETAQMQAKITELEAEMTSMHLRFDEIILPALLRIEHATTGLQQQLTEARDSTAHDIKSAVREARDEFRDHGGRRMDPRR